MKFVERIKRWAGRLEAEDHALYARNLIPALSECREKARQATCEKGPTNRMAAAVIVVGRLLLAALAILPVWRVI